MNIILKSLKYNGLKTCVTTVLANALPEKRKTGYITKKLKIYYESLTFSNISVMMNVQKYAAKEHTL